MCDNHSLSSDTDVKNEWNYPPAPPLRPNDVDGGLTFFFLSWPREQFLDSQEEFYVHNLIAKDVETIG